VDAFMAVPVRTRVLKRRRGGEEGGERGKEMTYSTLQALLLFEHKKSIWSASAEAVRTT